MPIDSFLTSIEAYIDVLPSEKHELVSFILNKYGANSLEDLNPCYYQEVFNELHTLVADN